MSKSTFSKYYFGREVGGHTEEYYMYDIDNFANSGPHI